MWRVNQLRENIEQDRRRRGTRPIVQARLASPDFTGFCNAALLSLPCGCFSPYLSHSFLLTSTVSSSHLMRLTEQSELLLLKEHVLLEFRLFQALLLGITTPDQDVTSVAYVLLTSRCPP